jgi:mediator of replication checkpoint protein 1
MDIKEQLSFLSEDSIIPDSQALDSGDEADEEGYPLTITRTNTTISTDSNGSKSSIVNRLHRKQIIEDVTSRPFAFQVSSGMSGLKRLPSLLRRTTTLSTTSESSTTTSTSNEKSVRLGGSKKSNIHYQATEAERMKTVVAAEQKRKAQLKKTVMSVQRNSIMGLLQKNGGGFE